MKKKSLYNELVYEFKKKLTRKLSSEEDHFLQWVSEQHEKENKAK